LLYDFAFIVQYSSGVNTTFSALFDMLLICDWLFLHVCILQEKLLFFTLTLGSVFSDGMTIICKDVKFNS